MEPHMPQLREFKHFFLQSLKSPDILTDTVEEYLAEVTGCTTLGKAGLGQRECGNLRAVSGAGPGQETNGKGVSCSNISLEEMELRFQQDPQVRGVSLSHCEEISLG